MKLRVNIFVILYPATGAPAYAGVRLRDIDMIGITFIQTERHADASMLRGAYCHNERAMGLAIASSNKNKALLGIRVARFSLVDTVNPCERTMHRYRLDIIL